MPGPDESLSDDETPIRGRTGRSATRALVTVGAVAGMTAAFVAGFALGGDTPARPGGDRQVVAAPPGSIQVSYSGAVGAADSCADLLGWYVERGRALVGPWGWEHDYGIALDNSGGAVRGDGVASLPDAAELATEDRAGSGIVRSTSGPSGTNVQEVGADEPDLVKTDGRLLVRVLDRRLVVLDVSGDDAERIGSLDLDGLAEDAQLLLSGDTVVVLGTDAKGSRTPGTRTPGTRVLVVDLSDPSAPALTRTAVYDAPLASARLHGDTVRLVLRSGLPRLDFVRPQAWRGEETALEKNRAAVAASTLEDWLPQVAVDGGDPELAVGCDAVSLPRDDDTALGTLSVVGFDADDPDLTSNSALAVDTDLTYFSADRMYVAASPRGWDCCWIMPEPGPWPAPDIAPPAPRPDRLGRSTVHEFVLDGTATRYTASGEVDGRIADRWSMDEHGGVLRVAVGATEATGNFNSVVTLRRDGDELVEIGRLDRLGVNEDIESMRWFDDLAIMVTFRRVDPLYSIDLTDPEQPRLLGKLKIPGFSEYLHPLGSDRLVGLGQGPTGSRAGWGAQLGLFDVTDLTAVRRIDTLSYGPGRIALAGADPRQFTWLPAERTLLTVITSGYGARTGWVSVVRLAGGELENRMVEVEHGYDVDLVRTVPLPDGRVVLVTGDSESFFEL